MLKLTPAQTAALRPQLTPERRHLIGLHIANTGNGVFYADRWPEPRAVLAVIGALCALSGDPQRLTPAAISERASGLMYCPREFLPLLEHAFPGLRAIDRVVFEQASSLAWPVPPGVTLRRLEPSDAERMQGLNPELHWINSTWGGWAGLSSSGYAWAAYVGGRPVSLASTFLVADGLEDIGVVTESDFRGRGLAVLCAAALCQDIQARGRIASWTTSHDNPASIRVAEKLGFKPVGPDVLYVLGKPAAG